MKKTFGQLTSARAGKPVHYFQDKLEALLFEEGKGLLNDPMNNTDSSDNTKLLTASFYSALTIARNSKPHTIMESTVMPIMIDAVREILGEDAALKISKMPHSNNTVHRRIQEMSTDVKKQLKLSVGESPFFALQFDESVDVSGAAQLLCYVKYVGEEEIKERMLFCLALSGRTTGECLFQAMMDKVQFF
ncbi:zinc finger MYM-type protein 6-like [Belonocnema kinseyi]|uniref:zinc finger MYM-type protein 6-like n=1 Tax=Belonocnema kinseyi TaxID=2817044 RepID=UPI00143D411C|nr:zinc finger MYM-type protein 6-like [Belonocnema kinseyi]